MFEYTETEKEAAVTKYFSQEDLLKLVSFPKKQKQKYLCLLWIKSIFDQDIMFSENEINEKLKSVYHDYVLIRRYMIDYKLLDRTNDGSSYWVA